MATVKQCDRCKKTYTPAGKYHRISLDQDGPFPGVLVGFTSVNLDLCSDCMEPIRLYLGLRKVKVRELEPEKEEEPTL